MPLVPICSRFCDRDDCGGLDPMTDSLNSADEAVSSDHEPPRGRWRVLASRVNKPGGRIALDTAITAAINASLLIIGSRTLGSSELTALSMMQLFASSAVILQRSTLLSPGLAARRAIGAKAAIPLRWSSLSVSLLSLSASFIGPLVAAGSYPYWLAVVLSLTFCASLLLQDYLRYVFFSREATHLALGMDVLWLIASVIFVAIPLVHPSWATLALTWAGASFLSTGTAAVFCRKRIMSNVSHVRLADTLRLGRWSGLDNLMSVFANLLPMTVATLAFATPLASSYRVLQTALGPLNIINTTLVAGFGLSSYKLTSRLEIDKLGKRVRRSVVLLGGATLGYVAIAFFAISTLSGISGNTAVRVSVILAVAALLGAMTTPPMAASSALGYQAIGVLVRVLVVILSISVSLVAAAGGPIPWNDPIGVVAVGAALLGLVGWGIGYVFASRRERSSLS